MRNKMIGTVLFTMIIGSFPILLLDIIGEKYTILNEPTIHKFTSYFEMLYCLKSSTQQPYNGPALGQ